MPRMSLAEEFYNDEDEHDNDGAKWLIIYDFSGKPNPRFWANLRRLSALKAGSRLLQFSVYITRSRRVVRVAVRLARHYGASVEAFRVEETFL